jgi:type II secretory pathway pseudopilin PulG
MKKQNLILAIIFSAVSITAYAATSGQQEKEAKSVAWYTANVRQARQKNKACYDNAELQSTEDCKNAQHALELVYVGVGN